MPYYYPFVLAAAAICFLAGVAHRKYGQSADYQTAVLCSIFYAFSVPLYLLVRFFYGESHSAHYASDATADFALAILIRVLGGSGYLQALLFTFGLLQIAIRLEPRITGTWLLYYNWQDVQGIMLYFWMNALQVALVIWPLRGYPQVRTTGA